MQPGAERVGVAQRAGPAQQDQERRLEGILDVARVVQQSPADGQDHRSVTGHQGLERGVIAPGRELTQQLLLRETRGGPVVEDPVDAPQDCPVILACHERRPR